MGYQKFKVQIKLQFFIFNCGLIQIHIKTIKYVLNERSHFSDDVPSPILDIVQNKFTFIESNVFYRSSNNNNNLLKAIEDNTLKK